MRLESSKQDNGLVKIHCKINKKVHTRVHDSLTFVWGFWFLGWFWGDGYTLSLNNDFILMFQFLLYVWSMFLIVGMCFWFYILFWFLVFGLSVVFCFIFKHNHNLFLNLVLNLILIPTPNLTLNGNLEPNLQTQPWTLKQANGIPNKWRSHVNDIVQYALHVFSGQKPWCTRCYKYFSRCISFARAGRALIYYSYD